MIYMPQVPLRFEDELLKKVDRLARTKYETRSDFIREAVIEKLKSEEEKQHAKDLIMTRYVQGKITSKELVKILGKKDAGNYMFFVKFFREGDKRVNRALKILKKNDKK